MQAERKSTTAVTTRKPLPAKSLPLPLNFLLGCSDAALDNYQLARLNELANLRKEMQALHDRMLDVQSQAAIAGWFKSQDRQSLKQAIENEETPEEWAKRMIRDGQRSQEELEAGPMPSPWPKLLPEVARARHSASSMQWMNKNIANGKCQSCTEPLDPNSVRYCAKHLAAHREKDRRDREKKGIQPGTHGRQLGTLANLAIHNEKRKRALLLKLGVKPKHAAISFNAAVEALGKIMPRSKAKAMTQAQLFQKLGISNTTGREALAEMLEAGAIERIGAGGIREPYCYWRKVQPRPARATSL